MSSIQSSFAQNKSRRFVALAAAKCYPASVLTGYITSATGASQVGSLYVFNNVTNYAIFVASLNTGTSSVTLTAYDTLVDMGHEINVGLAGIETPLLKLRLVKNTVTASSGVAGDGATVGFVVIENNAFMSAMTGLTASRAPVQVARV